MEENEDKSSCFIANRPPNHARKEIGRDIITADSLTHFMYLLYSTCAPGRPI